MKTFITWVVWLGTSLCCIGQQPPVNDTLIPKQHRRDTIVSEPKLKGGALIDTINTKDKQFQYRPMHIDSIEKLPPSKVDSGGYRKK